jgi:hypothetical protein
VDYFSELGIWSILLILTSFWRRRRQCLAKFLQALKMRLSGLVGGKYINAKLILCSTLTKYFLMGWLVIFTSF